LEAWERGGPRVRPCACVWEREVTHLADDWPGWRRQWAETSGGAVKSPEQAAETVAAAARYLYVPHWQPGPGNNYTGCTADEPSLPPAAHVDTRRPETWTAGRFPPNHALTLATWAVEPPSQVRLGKQCAVVPLATAKILPLFRSHPAVPHRRRTIHGHGGPRRRRAFRLRRRGAPARTAARPGPSWWIVGCPMPPSLNFFIYLIFDDFPKINSRFKLCQM
jgi:hypothetical protein